jgi:gamma-glutamyltranspeptidase/glutathione hydrolase
LGIVQYENRFPDELIAELGRRGHNIGPIENPVTEFVGGYEGVMRDRASGVYTGASELRLDGCALGL